MPIPATLLTACQQHDRSGYRFVFNLHLIDGYSHAEIAQLLGIAEGTSKSQLAKAKAFFFKMIKGTAHEFYVP